MPWNGRHDVLIDRFDARAVLDMVPLSPKVVIVLWSADLQSLN